MNEKRDKFCIQLLNFLLRLFLQKKTMKKRSERSKHCVQAVVTWSQKIFTPPHTPFPGVHDSQNLISWRWSLPSFTDRVWWKSMHAMSSYHGNRHCPSAHYRQDRLQYTAPLASAQCKYQYFNLKDPAIHYHITRATGEINIDTDKMSETKLSQTLNYFRCGCRKSWHIHGIFSTKRVNPPKNHSV